MSDGASRRSDVSQGTCHLNKFRVDSMPRMTNPVYYAGWVYAFGLDTRPVAVHRFQVSMEGKVGRLDSSFRGIPRKHAKGFLATCVYKERIYVFYDWDQGDWSYSIRYKSSSQPDRGEWDGEDPRHPGDPAAGANTGIVARYTDGEFTDSLHATVFNDRIYLFYMTPDARIEFSTFDGKKWEKGKTLVDKELQPHYAVTTVLYKDVPRIVVCAQEAARLGVAVFSFIKSDHSVEYGRYQVVFRDEWVANNDHLSLANGSLRGGPQDNVLQAFFTTAHRAHIGQLRRLDIDLATDTPVSWTDTGIPTVDVNGHRQCDVVHVPAVESDGKSFRHFLVVLSVERLRDHYVACYGSDRFVMVHEQRDLLVHSQEDAGAWVLLGAIEGVPPFTRNGAEDGAGAAPATSRVSYGLSSRDTVTVSTTFEASLGAFVGSTGTVELSMEIKRSFSATNQLSRTVTTQTTIPFDNTGPNQHGEQGYFIIQRPRLSNRNYQRKSWDGSKLIGTLRVTWISGIDVTHEAYELNRPPEGMQRRGRSSDLPFWEDIRGFPDYGEKVLVRQLNSIRAFAGRPPQTSGLSIEDVKKSRVAGGAELVLKAGSTIEKLFQVTGTASFKFSLAQEVSTAITNHITASLSLPAGNGAREEVTVKPAWLLPTPDAAFPREKRPYWIPNRYFRSNLVPWCLTWRVLKD